MIRSVFFLILAVIIIDVDYAIRVGYIYNATYVSNNTKVVITYNNTCSECICNGFFSSVPPLYVGLNCYTNNKTCELFANYSTSSMVMMNLNSTLIFIQQPPLQNTTMQQPSSQPTTTQQPSTQHTTTQQPSSQHTTTQPPSTQHTTTQQLSSQHTTTQQHSTQHTTTQPPSTQHTTTQQLSSQHTTTQQLSSQHTTTQQHSTQHTTTQQHSTQHTTTQPPSSHHTTTKTHSATTTCQPTVCSAVPSVYNSAANYQVEHLDFNCSQSLSNMTIIQVVKRTLNETYAQQYQTFWTSSTNMTYVVNSTQIIYKWYSLPGELIVQASFPNYIEAQYYYKSGSVRSTNKDTWKIWLQSICGDILYLNGTY